MWSSHSPFPLDDFFYHLTPPLLTHTHTHTADDGKNIRLALEGGWKYATHTPKGLNTEAIMAATATLLNSNKQP